MTSDRPALRSLAALFLRLGTVAFGGPAAHIAMMRQEVVQRLRWMTDAQFLDLVGATNLIPGPNSTEMAIHIGYSRAGWRGLLVAGSCFIMPAAIIVLALAALYVGYGTTPAAKWLTYGVKPVVIAVIVHAVWGLGRTAIRNAGLAALGVLVLGAYLLGGNEIVILLGSGILTMMLVNARLAMTSGVVALSIWLATSPLWGQTAAASPEPVAVSGTRLFWVFLKIGSVLYGSGYVLLAFLRADFVERLGWLTDRELLDAVAIGQIIPGPVFTTATFIGYVLGGLPAAALATLGIFLPAFVFVALSHPLIPRLRASRWAGAFLDGVNVASLALMIGVVWQLSRTAFVDIVTLLMGTVAGVLLFGTRINSAWLIACGAVVGLIVRAG
jgi:chromate transporter